MPPQWRSVAPEALERDETSIDLWTWEIADEGPGDRRLLDGDERARADRLVIPSKGRTWTASRAGMRRVLAGYLGVDPGAVEFEYGEHGKPVVRVPAGSVSPAPTFNLSHSASRALLAVTRAPTRLGVDVEQARDGRRFESIARNFFAGPERDRLLSTSVEARAGVFYRTWTCKEAYLKAWGTGLSFAASRFCVDFDAPDEDDARIVTTEMPGDDDPLAWRFRLLGIEPDYPIAVCWAGGARRLRTVTLDL